MIILYVLYYFNSFIIALCKCIFLYNYHDCDKIENRDYLYTINNCDAKKIIIAQP